MRVFMYPYKPASRSAKALKRELGIKFLRQQEEQSRVTLRMSDIIINWGSGSFWGQRGTIFNEPGNVSTASNKLLFFAKASEQERFHVPGYTTDADEARKWPICVARTLTRASGGRGIVITTEGQEPAKAPLYVKYVKKNSEFRIHVAFGRVIDAQRKIKDPNIEEPADWKIRNHDNGFIFVRGSGEPSENSKQAAIDAMAFFKLDFGAVDILETKKGRTYVLEINTAPGLEGQTIDTYTNAISQRIQEMQQDDPN